MDKKQVFGLIGSIILFIGIFTPICSLTNTFNASEKMITFISDSPIPGVILILLVAVSFILTLMGKYKGLWFTGIGAAFTLIYVAVIYILIFGYALSDPDLAKELGMSEMQVLGLKMSRFQIQWGAGLLVTGTALIIAAAAVKIENHSDTIYPATEPQSTDSIA